jgi:hypothetical protein
MLSELPEWKTGRKYRNELSSAQRQAHVQKTLVERDKMLRGITRKTGDVVVVASLAVLAWGEADLVQVLAGLAARGETLRALDTGIEVRPSPTAADIAAAVEAYREGRKRARETLRGETGGAVSAQKRWDEAAAKIAPHAHLWGMAGQVQKEVLALMGVSRNTAIAHLEEWGNAKKPKRRGDAGRKPAPRGRGAKK